MRELKSQMLKETYTTWLALAKESEIEFVDEVYALAEKNYAWGGDIIVESYTPSEILEEFEDLDDVRFMVSCHLSRALDCREGTDNDPELQTYKKFTENWGG